MSSNDKKWIKIDARFFTFFGILFSVLIGIWGYTYWSLVLLPQWTGFAFWVLTFLFIVGFVTNFGRWLFFMRSYEFVFFSILNYVFLGLTSHLILLAMLKDVSVAVGSIFLQDFLSIQFQQQSSLVIFGVALVANAIGSWTAMRGPVTRHVHIPNDMIQDSDSKIRIGQISDLHVGPLIDKKYVQRVIEQILRDPPDFIVITGDMVDGQVHVLSEALEPFRVLVSKVAVYYIPGNHEYYWNVHAWIGKAKELGFITLINEGLSIEVKGRRVWLAGVPDESGKSFSEDHSIQLEKCRPPAEAELSILLAHQPKTVFKASAAGFDLMLSGHTHWGQYFPFNLIIGWFNPYAKGLNKHDSMWIYVNAGTGFWGPPLRLGVPSEITLISV